MLGCLCTLFSRKLAGSRIALSSCIVGYHVSKRGLNRGRWFSELGEPGIGVIGAPQQSSISRVLGAAVGVIWLSQAYRDSGGLARAIASFFGIELMSGAYCSSVGLVLWRSSAPQALIAAVTGV